MSVPKLCYVVSAPITVQAFLRPHIERAAEGFEVSVVANGGTEAWMHSLGLPARAHDVPIVRPIAPAADLKALLALVALFRREKFSIVHSVTPKAGLLAALAGRYCDVPHRLHTFTGQVWATKQGLGRALLKTADRVIASSCTEVLADSSSQRDFLVAEGVVTRERAHVLGSGSICGVDAGRFRPDPAARAALRVELGIAETDKVLLFMGRLNRDKGVLDLARAFALLAERLSDVRLLLIGPDEEGLGAEVRRLLGRHGARLHRIDYVAAPERYYPAADLFCLPSYREGFGSTVLEAAACGLPAVASRIYGLTDAVQDGITGLLHPPGDADALAAAAGRLVEDDALRRAMGGRARARALGEFSSDRIAGLQAALYERLVEVTRPRD